MDFRDFEKEQVGGGRPVVFEYHPRLWKFQAEIMKKKGDMAAHDHAKKMVILCENRLQELADMVKEETDVYGSDTNRWFEAARHLHSAGLIAEALEYTKRAHQLEPSNPEISRVLLSSLSNARFYREAEKLAMRILKAGAAPSLIKQLLAASLVFQRKYADAIPVLEDISRTEPSNGPVWQLLSLSYGNLGRNQDAAGALRKMLGLTFEVEYARKTLEELESTRVGIFGGHEFRAYTASAVEKSADDSVVTRDEFFMMKQLLKDGATSEHTGMALGGDDSFWGVAVFRNLAAKGFVVFTSDQIVYLTNKGLKRIQEMNNSGGRPSTRSTAPRHYEIRQQYEIERQDVPRFLRLDERDIKGQKRWEEPTGDSLWSLMKICVFIILTIIYIPLGVGAVCLYLMFKKQQ